MLRKITFSLLVLTLCNVVALAQGEAGTLKGKVTDKSTKETIPFVNIILERNGVQVTGGASNIDGEFSIRPIPPGTYTVKASYVGFKPVQINGVVISSGKITTVNVDFEPSITDLKEFEVIDYEVPLIDDKSGETKTKDEIVALPTRNIASAAALTAGVAQADEGAALNVRGGRSEETIYFVDGVKVRGSANLPQSSIEQLQVITGGLPAQYGDATSGVISVTTRGPASEFAGGVEFVTSQLTDPYGYNLLEFNVSGPVWAKKDDEGNKKTVAGFMFSGQLTNIKDNNPSAIGWWKVKDDVLEKLEKSPLIVNPISSEGYISSATQLTKENFENVKANPNARSKGASLSGVLTFRLNEQMDFKAGGQFNYNYAIVGSRSIYNYKNNPLVTSNEYRIYGRFTHRLSSLSSQEEAKSDKLLKNMFYTIQVDYTQINSTTQHAKHRDDIFKYGYIGKFQSYQAPIYSYEKDKQTGLEAYVLKGFQDTLVTFIRSDANPVLANYVEQYYALSGNRPATYYNTYSSIQSNGGLINGSSPSNIYSLATGVGANYSSYAKSNYNMFRAVGSGNFDIKDHAIMFGFEYEKRNDRNHTVVATPLWTLMQQLANKHILTMDNVPHPVYLDGVFMDTIKYERAYIASEQSLFDKNLRTKLGLPIDGKNYIDIHSLDPSTYSLDMFSADELLNNGNQYVSYSGYDYTGKKIKGNFSLDKFLTDKDANGYNLRTVGAYQPIYAAGYIQDKFAFKDIIFNVGVRVDAFNANQPVLKDKYSLYETVKAGELNWERPSNIGDDYVVYVNDVMNPTKGNLIGYRKDNVWYDAKGTELTDPKILSEKSITGKIAPYLRYQEDRPNDRRLSSRAFENYKTQINVMPRVSFQFKISDKAQFYAHYDVLTQRPAGGYTQFNPFSYLYLESLTGNYITNPNLKPTKNIDYEVGFKQVINKASALTLSAYYREFRNKLAPVAVMYAFPTTYYTYDNVDFGTTKGFNLAYDLRRTQNIRINANYTLQFADGTGSSAQSNINGRLASFGQPSLRTLIPLDFDRRHMLNIVFDYRYGEKEKYNGPIWFEKRIFENTGANLTFVTMSGSPYTPTSNAVPINGSTQKPLVKGQINSARLPWQFRVNLRLDRDIPLTWGIKADEKKTVDLNVYLLIQNLLNTKNIMAVYSYTGNPDDDGYLASALAQQDIAQRVNQVAYIDQYNIMLQNPGFYSLPRTIRIGAILSF